MKLIDFLLGKPPSNEIPKQNRVYSNNYQIPESEEIIVYPEEVPLRHQKRPPVVFENGKS